MWTLKIKVREKGNLYGERAKKFKVKLFLYSQNYYEEKSKIYYVASGITQGEDKQKKKFFSDLRKDEKIVNLEVNNDFFMIIYSEKKSGIRAEAVKVAYNPRLIFLKPAIIDLEGWEEWDVASPMREDLEKFIYYAEKLSNVESKLFYLENRKIENLLIYGMAPKLTDKQREAVSIAIENGYFGYPRKIKLEQLAKKMRISLSTYQFHLAKAEAKLIPFILNKYIS